MNEKKQKTTPAVSIIIPVYNVAKWLDECLESVVGQTFSDFEVLLVDDGSTDDSSKICDKWIQKDERIKVIHKTNEGLSATRNRGVLEAKGKYIAFLDADDWLDHTFLEKMYWRAIENNADLVECDIWRYNDIDHTRIYSPCYGALKVDYSKEEHMIYGNVAIWKLLIRRKFWIDNKFFFYDCHSPATPVYALLIAKANRIENVKEALYFYRRFRAGSLTMNPRLDKENKVVGIRAFEYLLDNFKIHGLEEKFEGCLEQIIKHKMTDLLAAFFYRTDMENYKLLSKGYYEFIKEKFPKKKEIRYLTWGGYNLTRIMWNAKYLHDPYGRFNFSSLISLMNPLNEKVRINHKVRYRQIMLEREVENDFWNIMSEINPDYIIMDFVEERFDILEYGGGYLTKSDALDGADCMLENPRRIPRNTEKCRLLWEQSCMQFTERMRLQHPSTAIVLVRNYLSEKVGDIYEQEMYENLEEIRKMNEILRGYYDFFESCCKEGKVVEASACSHYFTDRQYEYGAIPSHLNERVNREIAGQIERSIGA